MVRLNKIYLVKLFAPMFYFNITLANGASAIGVSGTVTSQSDGETLPGITVLVKVKSIGTVTDFECKNAIEVSDADDVLVFSSIGYTSQEIPVNNRSTIDVVLVEDVKSLEEIVVIGYGTQKKSDLTGAVASIKAEKLLDRQSFNVSQALQGRLPGVGCLYQYGGSRSGIEDPHTGWMRFRRSSPPPKRFMTKLLFRIYWKLKNPPCLGEMSLGNFPWVPLNRYSPMCILPRRVFLSREEINIMRNQRGAPRR